MRVNAIRNCRPYSASEITKPSLRHGAINAPQYDTVSFQQQRNAVKGAGIGAALGVVALAIFAALTGGLATPLGYGLYAAAFGTAGGFTGKALDEMEDERQTKKAA